MKKCRIGVVGVGRGSMMWKYCKDASNADIVAICDFWAEGLETARQKINSPGVAYYQDYAQFLKHDMDAVLLANYANEHAPFAIAAMRAGKDVISEVLPAQNPAEAVALIECVEETGRKYCYAENYCFMGGPREMRRRYQSGELGSFEYGEGEYMHNCEPLWPQITRGDASHWRNNMTAFFYCTHSLGPLLHITGLRPVRVIGLECPFNERMARMGAKAGGMAVEMVTLENGAVVKSLHGVGCSKDSIWYSLYGSKGRMETAREDCEADGVSRLYENLDEYEGQNRNQPSSHLAQDELSVRGEQHGHGGSDYVCLYNAIEYLNGSVDADVVDVYEAVDMWLPGFFGYVSVLEGGRMQQIPNLRLKEERDRWRHDTRCTDPKAAGDQLLPSYSQGNPAIEPEIYARCRRQWEEQQPRPQLVMRWTNDGSPSEGFVLPQGVALETFAQRASALDDWLDIVKHGLTAQREDEAFYHKCMTEVPFYREDQCWFLVLDGQAAATITVICDPEKKEGYIHMVACKPEYRGRRLGSLLNAIALDVLKQQQMQTAYLTTDDWRIPAIRSYLRAGFVPDCTAADMQERWDEILKKF